MIDDLAEWGVVFGPDEARVIGGDVDLLLLADFFAQGLKERKEIGRVLVADGVLAGALQTNKFPVDADSIEAVLVYGSIERIGEGGPRLGGRDESGEVQRACVSRLSVSP